MCITTFIPSVYFEFNYLAMENTLQKKKMVVLDSDPIHNVLVSLTTESLKDDLDISFIRNASDLQNFEEDELQILAISSNPKITNTSELLKIKAFTESRKVLGVILFLEMEPRIYHFWQELGFSCFIPKPFSKEKALTIIESFESTLMEA